MATVNVIGGTADGNLSKVLAVSGHTWSQVAALTPSVNTTGTVGACPGRTVSGGYWELARGYLCLDVTPWQAGGAYAGSTITAVTLNLTMDVWAYGNASKVYYNDWGATLAAGDWGNLAVPASASYSHARNGGSAHVLSVALTDPTYILTYNGRLEIALDSEATEPTGVTTQNMTYLANNATAALRPSIDITYDPAASGCPKMTDHYARLRRG